jgi:hypothetical protein
LKVLVSFLSHRCNKLVAKYTLYSQMGLVGTMPKAPIWQKNWIMEYKVNISKYMVAKVYIFLYNYTKTYKFEGINSLNLHNFFNNIWIYNFTIGGGYGKIA